MEFIYEAFQYIANVFGSISDFFMSIPDLILEVFTYAWYWVSNFICPSKSLWLRWPTKSLQ